VVADAPALGELQSGAQRLAEDGAFRQLPCSRGGSDGGSTIKSSSNGDDGSSAEERASTGGTQNGGPLAAAAAARAKRLSAPGHLRTKEDHKRRRLMEQQPDSPVLSQQYSGVLPVFVPLFFTPDAVASLFIMGCYVPEQTIFNDGFLSSDSPGRSVVLTLPVLKFPHPCTRQLASLVRCLLRCGSHLAEYCCRRGSSGGCC
jgi:hypothetical protein